MKVEVQGPNINESYMVFKADKQGNIRFGLSALKGVGEGPVEEILRERKEGGKFESVLGLVQRLNLRSVNKKSLESLVLGGAFDQFKHSRATYFQPNGNYSTVIEQLTKYGNAFQMQKEQNQVSLFGDSPDMLIDEPRFESIPEWDQMIKLEKEKQVTGIYISGHPLDDYKLELKNFTTHPLDLVEKTLNTMVKVAGIVTESMVGVSQRGTSYARFTIQDYRGALDINLYNEDCEKWKSLATNGKVLYIEGINQQWRGSDRISFKPKDIKMLDTVGQLLTKSVTVKFQAEQLEQGLVNEFVNLCEEFEGTHKLKVKIVDKEDEMMIDLISGGKKVNANFEFINAVKEMGLAYKIN
jgi:DNA polymerase-3 subunit alpha